MTHHQIRELCLSLAGTTEEILWDDDLVFKVGGKMYFCTGIDNASSYSFKCSEEKFYELTELQGITPAPYLARAHWVQIDPSECKIKSREIKEYIRNSYDLVFAKLPKKTQKEILKELGDK